MRRKNTTLKDVANQCGVSLTAVSLVLNKKPSNLSDRTKKNIIEAAENLNYRPDQTARSLVTKKTNTIGVIVPDISNAFFSESVRHIQIELAEHGYDMFLCNSEEKFANDLKYLQLLISRNVDGLILTMSAESMSNHHQSQIKNILNDSNIPFVLFDRFFEGEESKVFVDNLQSGYDIARHLIDNGHEEIGIITGPMNLNSSRDRLAGVMKALLESNLTLKSEHIIHGSYDMETGRKGANQLLGKVTAIFAFNDLQAFGVIDIAKQRNMKIPNDVSLIGFDDIFYSTILDTRLTTVKQPIYDMSKIIAQLLVDMIKDEKHRDSIRMPAQLIVRDSVKKIR